MPLEADCGRLRGVPVSKRTNVRIHRPRSVSNVTHGHGGYRYVLRMDTNALTAQQTETVAYLRTIAERDGSVIDHWYEEGYGWYVASSLPGEGVLAEWMLAPNGDLHLL